MKRNRLVIFLFIASAVWLGLSAFTADAAAPFTLDFFAFDTDPDDDQPHAIGTFAIISVTTTADEYDTSGSGAGCSVREAVRAANTDADFGGCVRVTASGADQIWIPAGVYNLTRAGAGEDADLTGDLDITETVIISSTGGSVPTIRGGGAWADRVLEVVAGAVSIKQTNIGFGNAVSGRYGGGLLVDAGSDVTLINLTVGNNVADAGGGGILNNGKLTLQNSTVSANTASNNGGGGIYNGISGTLTILTSTISNNEATTGPNGGGGIFNDTNARATLRNTTISGNDVPDDTTPNGGGGGIETRGAFTLTRSTVSANTLRGDTSTGGGIRCDSLGRLVIENTLISGNSVTPKGVGGSSYGGGLATANCRTIIRDSLIRNNVVDGDGGGIHGRSLDIAGTTISANEAHHTTLQYNGNGGGISAGGTVSLTNSTISGNRAQSEGGGIFATDSLWLFNVTIANNTSGGLSGVLGQGGGIYVHGAEPVTMTNSALADNTESGAGDHDDCDGTIVSGGHNLIQNTSGCTLSGGSGDLLNSDARLNALANNGGPLAGAGSGEIPKTHAMQSDSPLIDAGDPSGCKNAQNITLNLDQRGRPRPVDGPDADLVATCDIGALEALSSPADVSVALVGPATVISPSTASSSVVYTLTVQNLGVSTVTNVLITDVVSGGLLWNSSSGTCGNVSGFTTISCTVGTLGPLGTVNLLLRYHVKTPLPACNTLFNNSATASATGESDTSNNSDSAQSTFLCGQPPSAVTISGPTLAFSGTAQIFNATVSPIGAGLPLTYTWSASSQTPVTHTLNSISDVVTFTWPAGVQTVNVSAVNSGGSAQDSHVITIVVPIPLYLPAILR